MAQNEMKAKPALPERVRSMEGLGVTVHSSQIARCYKLPRTSLKIVDAIRWIVNKADYENLAARRPTCDQ